MTTRQLFGGAIVADVPPSFDDVRQVPDHQEVFVDPTTEQSLIFDIMDRVEETDQQSAYIHFKELLTCNEGTNCQITSEETLRPTDAPHLNPSFPKILLVGTFQASKFNETESNTIQMYMCLVRLANVQTDFVITLNNAVQLNPKSSSAKHATQVGSVNPVQILKTTLQSLRFVDWSLFGA